jgi:N-dimethylarginine dimethylaminohydrolase
MNEQIDRVNTDIANNQWEALYAAISQVAEVKLLDPVENLPDLVFTANAGIVCSDIAIVSRFAKVERQKEEPYYTHWFTDNSYLTVNINSNYEGAGDHLIDSFGIHWLGTGFRTDKEAALELSKILNVRINVLELVDPRWYHLDTCFCPLSGGELLWYPDAFSTISQRIIRNTFDTLIDITQEDALNFACNAVCLNRNIYIPANSSTSDVLSNLEYNVQEFNLSEFMRAGGAAKCLTLLV